MLRHVVTDGVEKHFLLERRKSTLSFWNAMTDGSEGSK
jgi:hypothetical protein